MTYCPRQPRDFTDDDVDAFVADDENEPECALATAARARGPLCAEPANDAAA